MRFQASWTARLVGLARIWKKKPRPAQDGYQKQDGEN
jgi:hypothetical protein